MSADAWQPDPEPGRLTTQALPAPQLRTPPNGAVLQTLGNITLSWDLPPGTTQYHVQVVPFNGDGPGINLIRNAETSYTIPAPVLGVGPYIILPGMSYSWRVRVTDNPVFAPEGDPSWGLWSDFWGFVTPLPSADTIRPSEPQLGARATSRIPTLTWTDTNPAIFYYEVQLSQDASFNTDPFTATAAVYWNLVHGGITRPVNSWAVPQSAQLEPDTRYYWRLRPRVQGNATPVNWGTAFWFMTPDDTPSPDLTVENLELGASTVAAGGQVQIEYTVRNRGVGEARPTDVRAVLSTDVSIGRLDTDLGAIGTTPTLAGQRSATPQLATVTIPANTAPGTYFLGVYVDWSRTVEETDEGNNGLGLVLTVVPPTPTPGPTVTVTPPPTVTVTPPPPTVTPVPSVTLTISKSGSGSGTVTSAPAGINCGSTCTASFTSGTAVTLTASPMSGSTFGGWNGPCSGTGVCTVIITGNQSVTAAFVVPQTVVTWATKAPMPTARLGVGVAAATNGKIYAIGGYGAGGAGTATEEYNPTTNAWITKAPMPTSRYEAGVAAASNGRIFAIGGSSGPIVEEYDPVANTWTAKAPMPTSRGGPAVAAASNGRLYAVGGHDGQRDVATVEAYDPATNTWAAKASMPTARAHFGLVAAPNGKLYAIGGGNASGGLATVEEYDPQTNTWTTKEPMPTARLNHAVVTGSNGRIYAIGGTGATVEEYDPQTNTWASRQSMPTPRARLGAALGSNGKIYVIGGCTVCDVPLNTVEEATITTVSAFQRSPSSLEALATADLWAVFRRLIAGG